MSDIYAALPGITGKLELEYEGEMRGADTVVRDLIRTAVGKIYDRYFAGARHAADRAVVQPGRHGEARRHQQPTAAALADLKQIQGLLEKLAPLGVKASDAAPKVVAAAEFLLEGLVAHRKLSRSEERGFAAQEKQPSARRNARNSEMEYEDWQQHAAQLARGGLN